MNAAPKLVDVLLDLCRQAGSETIDPIDAAKAYAEVSGRGMAYQAFLPAVRDTAVELAKAGKITIYRKGVPVDDPATFRGVYRFGLAASGA
jgi:hypothetical protein